MKKKFILLLIICSSCYADWDPNKPADDDYSDDAAGEIRDNWAFLEVVFGTDFNTPGAYYQSTEPSYKPDGSTALDANDTGRLWIDSDDNTSRVYDGDSWEIITINKDVDSYDSFAEAVTDIGSTKTTLYIKTEQTVGEDVSVPSTLTLRFEDTGILSVGSGYTVTISGPIEAPLGLQIFDANSEDGGESGDGSVKFEIGTVPEVSAHWWGLSESGSAADNALALQNAIDNYATNDDEIIPVIILPGKYSYNSTLTFNNGMIFRGSGTGINESTTNSITELNYTGSTVAMEVVGGSNKYDRGIIENFMLTGTSSATTGGIRIGNAGAVNNVTFRNLFIQGFDDSTDSAGIIIVKGFKLDFTNCETRGNYNGMWTGVTIGQAGGGFSTCTFTNCNFRDNSNIGWYCTCGFEFIMNNCVFESNTKEGAYFYDDGLAGTTPRSRLITLNGGHVELNNAALGGSGQITLTGAVASAVQFIILNDVAFTAHATGPDVYVDRASYCKIINPYSKSANFEIEYTSNAESNYLEYFGDEFLGTITGVSGSRVKVNAIYCAIPVMTTGDATPSVLGMDCLRSLGTTTITDFDDGYENQVFTFIAETSITITDGTNIFLNSSGNYNMQDTDTLTLRCKADGKWYEQARSDN